MVLFMSKEESKIKPKKEKAPQPEVSFEEFKKTFCKGWMRPCPR